MPRQHRRNQHMQAMPLLGDMAQEKDPRVRAAYILLPLGGLAAAVVSTMSSHGQVNTAAPIFFLGSIVAAICLWIMRLPGRQRTIHLTVIALVAVLTMSLATLPEQRRPQTRRSPAGKMAGAVATAHTSGAQCLINLFSGRWEKQKCAPERPAKKKPVRSRRTAKP